MAVDLRTYVFLDSLQLQHAGFLGTVAQGFLPLPGDTSLWVEISPGIEITRITDVALKATRVRPGMQIVERLFGLLAGGTLYVLEVEPAGYAALAANEAEKAADINILEVRAFGSFGRVYLGGEERDIMAASGGAVAAIEGVSGRQVEGGRRD